MPHITNLRFSLIFKYLSKINHPMTQAHPKNLTFFHFVLYFFSCFEFWLSLSVDSLPKNHMQSQSHRTVLTAPKVSSLQGIQLPT